MTPRQAIREIKRLIDGTAPGANEWALNKVSECCNCLQAHSSRAEKITEIRDWADKYFSERKWQSVTGQAGRIALWVEIACDVVEASLPKNDSAKS